MPTHFKVDRQVVRRKTRRDRKQEAESAREYGFYTYDEFKLIPIEKIAPEAVWHPSRIEHIREALREGQPLPPIDVSLGSDGRYHISDGIHRYNASVEAGFTHVPAVVTVAVETPEMQEPELPERPALKYRDAVLVRDPKKWRLDSPWALIEEVLYESRHRGVKRHHYALVGIRKGEAEFIGDFRDDELDVPTKAPPAKLTPLFEAYSMWPSEMRRRVADRWLGVRPPGGR